MDLSTFAGTTFERTTFEGCLRASGLERLRGAAMPWADVVGNAGALATALGIRVLDDDEAQGAMRGRSG